MATIKIKFKDTLTLIKFDININFTSNGKNYKNINTYQYPSGYALNYDTYTACFPGNSWTNEANKYIEIDSNQPNFQTFINAMKSNIAGVELEAGTYKWVDEPTIPTISFEAPFTFITTDSYDYNKISGDTSHIVYTDFNYDTINAYTFSNKD